MAVLLALSTAVAYGVANFIGPLLSREAPTYVVLIAGQAVALAVSAAALLAVTAGAPGGGTVGAGLVTGLGNALGLIAFYRAASLGPLSIVAPIGSTAALVPVAVGVLGGEAVTPDRLAGMTLALTGVALAARRSDTPHAAAWDRRGAVTWALVAALGFGVFLAGIDRASADGVLWALVTSRASLIVILLASAWALRESLRVPLGSLPRLALPGVLLFIGTLAYAAATQEGDLSVVAVIGSLFPVVTVGLAFGFLGERLSRVQALGVAAALAGVVLLAAQ